MTEWTQSITNLKFNVQKESKMEDIAKLQATISKQGKRIAKLKEDIKNLTKIDKEPDELKEMVELLLLSEKELKIENEELISENEELKAEIFELLLIITGSQND